MLNKGKSILFGLGLLCVLVLSWFSLFYRLDAAPMRLWDESRLAVGAVEMVQDHDVLIVHYMHESDHWSTKPPLMIWCQAFFVKLIGPSVIAVRLPSALAVLIMALLLYIYFYRRTGEITTGLCSAIVLLSNHGLIASHVARTADYDALLSLLMMLYMLAFYHYAEADKPTKLAIISGAFFLMLAALTKSIAAFIPLPSIALYFLLRKRMFRSLKDPYLYLSILIVVLPLVLYYFLREQRDAGYFKAAMTNDAFGRFSGAKGQDVHPGPWYFYVAELKHQFSYWLFLLPLLLVAWKFVEKSLYRMCLYFLLICIGSFFFLSISYTKLPWYIAPYFSGMSIIVGICFSGLLKYVMNSMAEKRRELLSFLMVLLVAIMPVYHIITWTSTHHQEYFWQEERMVYGDVMKSIPKEMNYLIYTQLANSHIEFHTAAANANGQRVKHVLLLREMKVGDTVLVAEQEEKATLHKIYEVDTLMNKGNAYLLHLKSLKAEKP
jgi:4-amino-4-deoxy-L-arabinose transferase-like glycosyltransferase